MDSGLVCSGVAVTGSFIVGPRLAPGLTELPEANEDLDDRSIRGSVVSDRRPPTSSSPPPPYAPTATPPLTPAAVSDH